MWIYFGLFYLIQTIICSYRTFPDEYPNITVCESTMKQTDPIYDMPYSYRALKGHLRVMNCTHIEGNLVITNIYPDPHEPDFSFLNQIVEVSGYVYFHNISISQIILPRLQIIRGEFSISKLTWNGKIEVSLLYHFIHSKYNDNNTKFVILPSLRVIQRHWVYFESEYYNKQLIADHFNGLPYSIDWTQLFEDQKKQQIFIIPQLKKNESFCHANCFSEAQNLVKGHCWSNDPSHCQLRNKCDKISDCKWCWYRQKELTTSLEYTEHCCQSTCTGGCYGATSTKCYACSQYQSGPKCVDSCPSDEKVHVSRLCSQECPDNLVLKSGHCVAACSSSEVAINNVCIPCSTAEMCAKYNCTTKQFEEEQKNETNQLSFVLTSKILEKLKGCIHIEGKLYLSPRSFDPHQGNVTIDLLYDTLNDLESLTGELSISGENVIKQLYNLTFLDKLEIIKKTGASSTNTPSIFLSELPNLEFLGLRRLRRVFGSVTEDENPKLCYWDTLPWESHILKLSRDYKPYKPKDICKSKNCSEACDVQYGCWGPSSTMCFRCHSDYVRAGNNCVKKCVDEPLYYHNNRSLTNNSKSLMMYDDGTCLKCHELCGISCTGPNVTQCIGECKYFKENTACVRKCSDSSYSANKQCYPCPDWCVTQGLNGKPVCTGKSPFIYGINTVGGCSKCQAFILTNDNRIKCTLISNHIGYYSSLANNTLVLYRPCKIPCGVCSRATLYQDGCSYCHGYWSMNSCVKECPTNELPSIIENVNTKNSLLPLNSTCIECHSQCKAGCTWPHNATACIKCRTFGIYDKSNITRAFECVSSCPLSSKLMIGHICLNNQQLDQLNKTRKNELVLIISILIPIILFICIAILIVFLIIKIKTKQKRKQFLSLYYSNLKEPDSKILMMNKSSALLQPNMNRLLIISPADLIFNIAGKKLGQGAFGDVYKGSWRVHDDQSNIVRWTDSYIDVAIKVIGSKTYSEVQEILKEAKVMASVTHRYCLRLIGVCHYEGQVCLVTNFMGLGSLDKYLQLHTHDNVISSFHMLSWAEQIANAMVYLEMRGIIHRDLAARNVLLQNENLIQITDFGLSKILQGTEENNEIVITTGRVPVRWLAIETLTSGIYSHKTDVWSYGVTLWEIFSYGACPYSKLAASEIPNYILQGNRLLQPEITSPDVFSILCICWHEQQFLRPSFKELMTMFSNFCRNPTYYLRITNDKSLMLKSQNLDYNHIEMSQMYPKQPINKRQKSIQSYGRLSADGTVCTELNDYLDNLSGKSPQSVRRQYSNLSNVSNESRPLKIDAENRFPLLQNDSIISDETENYLEPIRQLPIVDESYLEPIHQLQMDDESYLEPILKR